jgi:hypothetical protein
MSGVLYPSITSMVVVFPAPSGSSSKPNPAVPRSCPAGGRSGSASAAPLWRIL